MKNAVEPLFLKVFKNFHSAGPKSDIQTDFDEIFGVEFQRVRNPNYPKGNKKKKKNKK